MKKITKEAVDAYRSYLVNEEKSMATIEKYTHDVLAFSRWLGDRTLTKAEVLTYKSELIERHTPASVNVALSSLNSFFGYMEWHELRVKRLRIQRQIFASSDKELTRGEYERLLSTARQNKDERLYLLMQTICSTGIRVSEVQYVTVKAVSNGEAEIRNKGKQRRIYLPGQLCTLLKQYIKKQNIQNGAVFITKSGAPLDRSNIWSAMKKLCRAAHVSEKKVYPHNLRHLFARTYYELQKDIVRLSDILGHSNIDTTRIYTMESGAVHRKQIQKIGALLCREKENTT